MPSLPRIITVDPTATLSQQVRSALDLMDRAVIQIDTPGALDALEELKRGECHAVITAWECGDNMRGWEIAAKIKQAAPETAIIVVADYEDVELDEETRAGSPFVYLRRPFDVPQFLRVLDAAVQRKDIFEAMLAPMSEALGGTAPKFGGVPSINIERAKALVHQLLIDLNAMAILFVTREGKVLIEQGTVGYIQRDEIANALSPSSVSHLTLRDMIGGNASLFQFYDGEAYDVYVLSVGLHHQLCVIFDGQKGGRELGAVRNFGRRATEDLIGILGADAWLMHAPVIEAEEERLERSRTRARATSKRDTSEEPVALARAEIIAKEMPKMTETTEFVSNLPKLEAIEGEIDLDLLFAVDETAAEDLFSLDVIEQEVQKVEERASGGKLDWDKAQELGLLGGE
jgi:DNA-binding NarL/FixJ family response regulator